MNTVNIIKRNRLFRKSIYFYNLMMPVDLCYIIKQICLSACYLFHNSLARIIRELGILIYWNQSMRLSDLRKFPGGNINWAI